MYLCAGKQWLVENRPGGTFSTIHMNVVCGGHVLGHQIWAEHLTVLWQAPQLRLFLGGNCSTAWTEDVDSEGKELALF